MRWSFKAGLRRWAHQLYELDPFTVPGLAPLSRPEYPESGGEQELPMQVQHDSAHHRFVARTPSGVAVLAYTPRGPEVLDLYSTYVPVAERGRGIGARLVQEALAYAREQGLRIIATCWYVRVWIERHPEERDLLAA